MNIKNSFQGMNALVLVLSLTIISCSDNSQKTQEKKSEKVVTPLFSKLSATNTGIDFENRISLDVEAEQFDYSYTANGGGVAIADLNNDGLQDIYFVANVGRNKCYFNQGDMKFKDVTETAGVGGEEGDWCCGVTCADVNADGWLDIYVTRSGNRPENLKSNLLYINQKDGTFLEKAEEFGVNDNGNGTQSAFFDYDQDGDLDLYVMNHPMDWKLRVTNPIEAQNRKNNSDKLYRNDAGKFKDVSENAGLIPDGIGFGLGLGICHLNDDHYPDIFVGNDYSGRDYLYINKGDGTGFEEVGTSRLKHMSQNSMGVDINDIDNDGDSDILVLDMNAEDNFRQKTQMPSMNMEKFWRNVEYGEHFQYMYNMLHLNNGEAMFSEIGQMSGISNTDWSWSVLAADYDLDGLKDLYVTNGYPRDVNDKDVKFLKAKDQNGREVKVTSNEERLPLYKVTPIPNYSFQNKGNLTFEKTSNQWGLADIGFSMGASYADLDNDGDLDLVVNNYNDTAFVYENTAADKNLGKTLTIKLSGPELNPFGIGARVEIVTDHQHLTQDIFPTRGYQSSVPLLAYFGIAKEDEISSVSVRWPNGKTQNATLEIEKGILNIAYDGSLTDQAEQTAKTLMEESTEENLSPLYHHKENPYNDFEKEVLLPQFMSHSGPALAIGDLNGDGKEDFVMGGAAGQTSAFYLQTNDSKFVGKLSDAMSKGSGHEDVAVAIFDFDGDGDNDIYMGSGGNEHEAGSLFYQDRLYRNDNGSFVRDLGGIPDLRIATKTLATNDFDNDGDVDIFIGAGHIPRQYGASASSFLLRNENGKLIDVTAEIAPDLVNLGMVNTAIWANVDGEAGDELIIAGEWMPITILKWNGQTLENITEKTGLAESLGWWSTVTATDIDNDGDLDLLAGNLGLNYKYKASPTEPFSLFAGDYDESGTWDIALGYYNSGTLYPVRGRQCSSEQIPSIKKKFPTYKDFGTATLYDVYGEDKLNSGIEKTATQFASMYLENDGTGKFKQHLLPMLAQVSSINAFVVLDLNKDGNKDVILAGNLYGSEVETPRNDASNGLVLIGNGKGGFTPLEHDDSGFIAGGDVKQLGAISINNGTGIIVGTNSGTVAFFVVK